MSPRRGDGRELVTVLFTDIVGSTEIAAELGDRRWRDLVRRHHEVVRRALRRFGGRELDTAGDGFFARFDRPADAIRCACQISDEVRDLGVEVRAGLHVGEAEVLERKVGGIAVNVGARVMGAGKGGEVLVSSTLRDAVAGAGFEFADHGLHRLKGLEGEFRLYEVVAIDGVRRPLPLTPEEARTRRGFVEATPIRRRRERVLAAAVGALVVAAVVVAVATGTLREATPAGSDPSLSPEERALAALVPSELRPSCERAESRLPDATAALDCGSDAYAVTYSRFATPEEMQERFDAFASAVTGGGDDCARDPSATNTYRVNGIPRGFVACYVDNRRSGLSSASSVIVWTDEELLVLGRALREDAADLTLYEWWRTEAGPLTSPANPPKEGDVHLLDGFFEVTISKDETGTDLGMLDPSWAKTWTLRLSAERGFEGMPTYREDGELLFGKPDLLILNYGEPFPGFGADCPSYQSVTWRERGDTVTFGNPVGHCRERNLDILTFKPWTRIA